MQGLSIIVLGDNFFEQVVYQCTTCFLPYFYPHIFSLFSKNPPKDLCKTTDKYSKKRKVISKRRSSYAY